MDSIFSIIRAKTSDNLVAIAAQIQPELWDEDNEMTAYEPELLKKFLDGEGNHLVLVYEGDKIAGIAIAHELLHPAADGSSLYVHELDAHPDYRQKGVGTMLMEEMFKIAKERGLAEVWLGADDGNEPAHALYKKLKPTEEDPCTIYSYKIDY
jgi:aminoglycoside 3-N-acetyltransferase I